LVCYTPVIALTESFCQVPPWLRRVGVLARGCAMTKADYGWLILGIILLFLLFVVWAPH
jgi:hypothetical protein